MKIKKNKIIILGVIILLISVAVYFALIYGKGTYSPELTEQYTRATMYTIMEGELVPILGSGFRIYVSGHEPIGTEYDIVTAKLHIYCSSCFPLFRWEEYTKEFEVYMDKGIIELDGWTENTNVYQAWVNQNGGVIPEDGPRYFYYNPDYGNFNTFNVILYHLVAGDDYSTVKALGTYENDILTLYYFEGL